MNDTMAGANIKFNKEISGLILNNVLWSRNNIRENAIKIKIP